MCTVTWQTTPDGYLLFMNRDELTERGAALSPRTFNEASRSVLAPIDPDAGGTWIATNDAGLTVCLLNRYPHAEADWAPPSHEADTDRGRRPPAESRGLLVRRLAGHATVADIADAVRHTDLRAFSAFTLLAFESQTHPLRARWDGYQLDTGTPSPPVVSSSFRGPEVAHGRIELYRQTIGYHPSLDSLRHYHSSHVPEKGPYSVCVHRDDGGTVSLTEVHVTRDTVTMRYTPGPPCEAHEPIVTSIARCE